MVQELTRQVNTLSDLCKPQIPWSSRCDGFIKALSM